MRRALLFVLAVLTLPAQALELKPFSASYTADWKQIPVSGSAERSLQKQADGRWLLNFKAAMLVASLTEESTFRIDGTTFLPLTYRYDRSGLGKGKSVELDFDWDAKKVIGSDRGDQVSLPLNRGIQDKSTYQVVDGGDIETYDFRVLGEEKVETMAGSVDAIKVERVRDPTQSSRKTVLWFAKDWNYLLVRLYQVEKDGKEYQIMLKDGSVDGKAVKGS
jgi:hypothetical protein